MRFLEVFRTVVAVLLKMLEKWDIIMPIIGLPEGAAEAYYKVDDCCE